MIMFSIQVRCHRRHGDLSAAAADKYDTKDEGPDWGWSIQTDGQHTYLAPLDDLGDDDGDPSENYDAFSEDSLGRFRSATALQYPEVDVWHLQFDPDTQHPYYYNKITEESKWTAPEWVEETDPETGARYYVKLSATDANPLLSTWTKPSRFSRLVREDESGETVDDQGYSYKGTLFEDQEEDFDAQSDDP